MTKHSNRGDGSGRHEPLNPGAEPLAWERAVGRIVAAAEPELERRRQRPGLVLDRWAGPLLAAAASLILLASGGLLWSSGAGSLPDSAGLVEPAFEETLFPPVVARWLRDDAQPTVEELVYASFDE